MTANRNFSGVIAPVVTPFGEDGTPDPTLDVDGRVTTDVGGQDEANGVVVQPNGKIVAAGGSDGDFALIRYKGGGKFDPSFGTQGQVVTDFGGVDVARAVVRLPDGRFVAVGGSGQDFAVARYTFKGDPDSTFGTLGKVTTDFGGDDRAEGVVLPSDGHSTYDLGDIPAAVVARVAEHALGDELELVASTSDVRFQSCS